MRLRLKKRRPEAPPKGKQRGEVASAASRKTKAPESERVADAHEVADAFRPRGRADACAIGIGFIRHAGIKAIQLRAIGIAVAVAERNLARAERRFACCGTP